MDVKTTFQNGNLEEDVYMIQPEGFVDPNNAEKICNLIYTARRFCLSFSNYRTMNSFFYLNLYI